LDEKLRSAGHKTWIDNSGLTNDALDGMAHAVEGAKVVLLLMSSEYANSFNCRMEAQYAVELKKAIIPIVTENNYQARGWLGEILFLQFNKQNTIQRPGKFDNMCCKKSVFAEANNCKYLQIAFCWFLDVEKSIAKCERRRVFRTAGCCAFSFIH